MSKRNANQPKPGRPARGRAERPALPLSTARKWLFSLVGFVLLPLLLLGALELVLRLAGYGYSTAFFRPFRIGNKQYLVENDKFGLRFFPPELARSPPPVVMRAKKGARTYRIFLLGESAALGDPRPAYGAGRYLQTLLRERFPGVEFEVICGAVTAINSYGVLPIAQECARHEGDLWIVYMGNNEMVGPFGAATVFGAQSPPRWEARLGLAVQKTRLGQLLLSLGRHLTGSGKHGPSWGGMQMFLENRLPPQDPRKETVYQNFRRNLADILRAGQSAGVPMVLSTVAVNLKDCPPFASLLAPTLSAADRQTHGSLCAQADEAAAQGRLAEAVQKLERAAHFDARFAELQFRWGACLLGLATNPVAAAGTSGAASEGGGGQADKNVPVLRSTAEGGRAPEAGAHFQEACDDDALPFRADSRLNGLIAQAAREFAGPRLVLCDAAAVLATNSPSGIAGKEAFYEHVHLSFDGNYLLARAWAAAAERFLPESARKRAAPGWASQARCEQRLGLTDWNRYAILEDIVERLSHPPFTGQLQHTQAVEGFRAQMRELRRRTDRFVAAQARAFYLAALNEAPDDHRLHENFAQFLEAIGDLPRAVGEWQRVRELIPQHHAAWFQAGRLQVRRGELDSARTLLAQAVLLRPDLAEGWLELGNLHALKLEPALALKDYERVRRLAPNDPRVYYHLGKALAKLNRRADALASFRHALRLRPDYWEAHYALGEELAFADQPAEARQELEEVIRLKPDYAMAHLNLGVALARSGELDQARGHIEEAARLDPNNPQAREYLEQLRSKK